MTRPRGPRVVPRTAPAVADAPGRAGPLVAALAVLLAVRVAAAGSGSNWLWGFDTLRYWPLPLGLLVVLLAAAGFVPPFARAIERALAGIATAWERARGRTDALVALAVAAAVYALRDRVQFAGDFVLRVGSLPTALDLSRLFPQAFPLDALPHFRLARALVHAGLEPEDALQAIGAAMAMFFATGCIRFVRALGARGAAFATGVLSLLAGGLLPHFAGYDKYGPMLAGMAFAAAGAVRLLREGSGEWELAAGAAAAVLTHRAGFVIVPAVAVAFGTAYAAAGVPARRTAILAAALAFALVLAALVPFAWHVLIAIDASVHLPGGAVARSLQTRAAPDALLRLTDTLNAIAFLVPLALAAPFAAGAAVGGRPIETRAGAAGPLAPTAWTALAGALALMLVVRASRGGGRDWDASSGPAFAIALVSTGALLAAWRRPGAARTMAPAVTLSLAAAATTWGLHASERMNVARIETMLNASPPWSDVARSFAHDHMGAFALNHARWDDAARHFDAAYALEPNPRYVYQAGLAQLQGRRFAAAEGSFRESIRRGATAAEPWTGLATIALSRRDSAAALTLADSALARDARNAQALGLVRALGGTAGLR